MKKAARLALVFALLVAASWLSAPDASASGLCQIWCDNGRTVSGDYDSYWDCLQAFLGNCEGNAGTFCYTGYPCQTN